jgi:FKBP-type peptidyl-prolyl cis-trans isomerase FkpA
MVHRVRFAILLVSLAAGVSACGGGYGDSPTSPSTPSVPFSATELRVGTGADATAGRTLTVNYTGWLYSATAPDHKGTQFDSSAGGSPFVFPLGAGRVIAGWDSGLVGMKVGGLRRLIIPPNLAYGSQQVGPIPPNSTLVFDVELLNVS